MYQYQFYDQKGGDTSLSLERARRTIGSEKNQDMRWKRAQGINDLSSGSNAQWPVATEEA